jgi:hypothetical protein
MTRAARNLLLTFHVSTSVGFVGAIAAFLSLAVAGALHQDQSVVRGAYIAMNVITTFVIVPLCFAALLTGVIQSLITPWGVIRHYWVLVKLVLTLLSGAVLLLHTNPIEAMAQAAHGAPLGPEDFYGQRRQLIIAAAGALLIGLGPIVLSIYKPAGITPYGWRKKTAAA